MKKKSLFSILYSSALYFIFCFIFQIQSFDTIKSVFNKSIETVKKGYNWLRGNDTLPDESQQKIRHLDSLDDKKSDTQKKDKLTQDFAERNLPKTLEPILPTPSSIKEEKNKKIKKKLKKLNNRLADPQHREKLINKYIAQKKKESGLSNEEFEKIKESLLTQIKSDPNFINTISTLLMKNKITNKIRRRKNGIGREKNNNSSISTQPLSDQTINNQSIQNNTVSTIQNQKTTDDQIVEDKKRIDQKVEQLLVYSKNTMPHDKAGNNLTPSQPYKNKYFSFLGRWFGGSRKKDNKHNENKTNVSIDGKTQTPLLNAIKLTKKE